MTRVVFGFAVILAAAPAGTAATTPLDIKPGEWETTSTRETSGQMPIPQEVLDEMSPEQRARLQQAMQARAAQAPKTTIRKSCIRKEQLDRAFSGDPDSKSCKQTIATSSPTKQEVRIECENESGKQGGTLRLEAIDSGNVKGSLQMTASNGGRSMHILSNFSAKWLGPVCSESRK